MYRGTCDINLHCLPDLALFGGHGVLSLVGERVYDRELHAVASC